MITLTKKDYCDYETCVALKELGYVGICDAYYELTGSEDYNRDSFELLYTRDFIHPDNIDRVAAPLLYQAQKWLREEKKINVYVKAFNGEGWYYIIQNYNGARIYPPLTQILVLCHSYEKALLEGIKEAVKILKKEK